MSESAECQTKYLSSLIKSKALVSVYLKNGIKLTGKIMGATETIIFLDGPTSTPQIIYKSNVSTIVPNAEATTERV